MERRCGCGGGGAPGNTPPLSSPMTRIEGRGPTAPCATWTRRRPHGHMHNPHTEGGGGGQGCMKRGRGYFVARTILSHLQFCWRAWGGGGGGGRLQTAVRHHNAPPLDRRQTTATASAADADNRQTGARGGAVPPPPPAHPRPPPPGTSTPPPPRHIHAPLTPGAAGVEAQHEAGVLAVRREGGGGIRAGAGPWGQFGVDILPFSPTFSAQRQALPAAGASPVAVRSFPCAIDPQ